MVYPTVAYSSIKWEREREQWWGSNFVSTLQLTVWSQISQIPEVRRSEFLYRWQAACFSFSKRGIELMKADTVSPKIIVSNRSLFILFKFSNLNSLRDTGSCLSIASLLFWCLCPLKLNEGSTYVMDLEYSNSWLSCFPRQQPFYLCSGCLSNNI